MKTRRCLLSRRFQPQTQAGRITQTVSHLAQAAPFVCFMAQYLEPDPKVVAVCNFKFQLSAKILLTLLLSLHPKACAGCFVRKHSKCP